MSEAVRESVRVDAGPDAVMAVVSDVASYPEWQDEIKLVEVLDADSEGRPLRARFRVDAKVLRTTYTLVYEHSPREMSWDLEEGDQVEVLRGRYLLDGDGDGPTDLTYELEVVPKMKLPGMVRRRAARRIVEGALDGVRQRVESQG